MEDVALVIEGLPSTQQIPKPMSLSVKVRLGKQDSSSSSFLLKMFLKSIIIQNEPEGTDASLFLAPRNQQ